MKKLSPLEERFSREYVIDLKPTAAYIRAGGAPKSANRHAYEFLRMPHVAERVAVLKRKICVKLEVSAERVISELAKVAFANIGTYVTDKGIDLTDLPPELWAPIQEVIFDDKKVVRFKMLDKLHALELLGKHLKLFTDKIEWLGDDSFVKLLEAARSRVKK